MLSFSVVEDASYAIGALRTCIAVVRGGDFRPGLVDVEVLENLRLELGPVITRKFLPCR